MTRIFDPKRKSGVATALGSGADSGAFSSAGVASVTDASKFLAQFGGASVVGEPGLDEVEGTAGNASHTITVPTGKYWRLVGLFHLLVTDATAANRAVVVVTRTAADAAIETITHANVAASTTAKRVTLFGTDDNVRGDRAVASQGTLTMDTKPTADDTVVINGQTITWKAALTGTDQVLIGAAVANSKTNLEAALASGTRTGGGTLHTVSDATLAAMGCTMGAFTGNDAVFTANVKGVAGDAITTTETFTAGTNVFDAGTLGTTTAGLDAADKVSTLDHPTAGPYLGPGEDINISVTNGVAGDVLDTYLFYLEFDANVS